MGALFFVIIKDQICSVEMSTDWDSCCRVQKVKQWVGRRDFNMNAPTHPYLVKLTKWQMCHQVHGSRSRSGCYPKHGIGGFLK